MAKRVAASGGGDGPWFGPQQWWRSKTAEQNIDTRMFVPEDALQLAPMVAAVMVLAKMASSAEMVAERLSPGGEWERADLGLPDWANPARRPNSYQSRSDFIKMIALNLMTYGNALVVRDRSRGDWVDGYPNRLTAYPWWDSTVSVRGTKMDGLEVIDPENMRDLGVPGYGGAAGEVTYSVGGHQDLKPLTSLNPSGDVIHLKYSTLNSVLFGQSPLGWAAQAVRTAVAADAYAEMSFRMGFSAFGMLAHKGGKPGDGLVTTMREYMKKAGQNPRNRFGPLVTSGEWNYHRFGVPPEELQLLSTRKMSYNTAAALTGVQPELIGSPDAKVSGSGIRYAQQALSRLHGRDFLLMISDPLTEATPDDFRIRLVPTGLSELDPLEKSKVDDRLIRVGVKKPSEVRQELGLAPIDGLDEYVCDKVVGTSGGEGEGDGEPGPDSGTPEENPTTPGGEM